MLDQWHTGVFTRITQETPNTRRFWIRIPGLEKFDFKAGQFVTLDLPIHEKKARRWRSYSIASGPDGTNEIELVIVLLEGGLGTNYLFNQIREGSEVLLRGPQGVFTLPDTLENDLFLICTGTGIAPFRSMVHHLKASGKDARNVYIISGTRTRTDLLYHEEMLQLQAELNNFHYIPTLSRESWEGKKGYVHEIYEELLADRRAALFYLCGWKAMIDEAKKRIISMGYDRKGIHQELYG
ncbi:MAG TPA: FAD-binding oxidoreductase [Chitinophagaceae bacterium]|nr:FAD-binding oxidoreductase [Chitinophagaceae bacterium]